MSLQLKFNIILTSDYHISAGHGKGALIDSALLRDGDGVPVIRGTTLTGLLRDGLWRLLQTEALKAKGYNVHGEGQYCGHSDGYLDADLCPICRLFGTPRRPKSWHISSARLITALEPTGGGYQPEGQIATRVRISPYTRRAEPRKLFSQEEGEGQWTFQFTVTWPVDDVGNLDEAALLVAAARNVRQLGRSRRRGRGECLFTLVSVEGTDAIAPARTDTGEADWQTPLLERFVTRWIEGEASLPTKPTASFTVPDELDGNSPIRVRIFVRADEPLLLARRAEAGNQFESQFIVPGQAVRGALAWRAAHSYDLGDDRTYAAFVQTFLRNEVLFPCLYPAEFETSALRPTIPSPRDLLTCKVGGFEHGLWFATAQVPEVCPEPGCDSALDEVQGFVTLLEYTWPGNPLYDGPKRSSEMHIRIDQKKGRVKEGDLFGYVALDTGQYFVGDLVCVNEAAWSRLQMLAHIEPNQPVTLRLGKGRRRGYGKVTAWFQVGEEDDVWVRQSLEKRVSEIQKDIRLMLLTDTIITDRWGRYVVGFDRDWLSEILGQKVKRIISAAAGVHMIDGFNSEFGLPRGRDIALSAGSTVRLELEDNPNLDAMRRLEWQGIGLRRNEGFGRIAFNHPVYNRCQGITSDLEFPQSLYPGATFSSDEADFLEEWTGILDDHSLDTKCKEQRFIAVARWLYSNSHLSPAKLREGISKLGQLDNQAIELLGGKKEYGKRHTLKPEQDRLSKQPCVQRVVEILEQLETGFEDRQHFFPLAIQMLADRVAAKAGKSGEGEEA